MLGKPVVAPEGAAPPVQPETSDSVTMHNAANRTETTDRTVKVGFPRLPSFKAGDLIIPGAAT